MQELTKLALLQENLQSFERVVVAFSGGVDSALLARVAHDTLGPERCHVVTAASPSLAGQERQEAGDLAAEWGLRWTTVDTDEMDSAAYRVNDANRCGHCKDALMDALDPLAKREKATVLLGVNVDDLGDHRPGQEVAAQRGARFPLVDAGLTKEMVRNISKELGLRTWDKPAAACLASRLPYGTPVSVSVLSTVERAEAALKELGFVDLRVRHYADTARLEISLKQLPDVLVQREEIVDALHQVGYRYVTLDLEGIRSGNLNQALEG
ncbi:MAG: ATP-dependent sacrificial sulfur transferase LarE [Acidimicrobiales bacterium]|nr:ATP-dependent sacrificial sulfur transferase LarE [Acidimicrobiales bacterium]